MLGTALANAPGVQLVEGSRKNAPADLQLTGRHRTAKGTVHVEARLEAKGGALLTGQRSCPVQAAERCVAELGEELAAKLPEALQKRRHLFKELTALPGNGGRPVRIGAAQIENVFPSRLGAYLERPLGHLKLENTGDEPVEDLVVRASLRGFTTGPSDQPVGRIAPGKAVDAPVKVVLDAAALARHSENQPAVLDLELRYRVGELNMRETRAQPLVVYGHTALSWAEPASVASFVAARSVTGLAEAALRALPQDAAPIAPAVALYLAMAASGLRYVKDPAAPFGAEALDYVQYPRQTLARKAGDCDDLAVLYASLAESVGTEAMLVITPDHAFVAVEAGSPPRAVPSSPPTPTGPSSTAERSGCPSRPPSSASPSTPCGRGAPRSGRAGPGAGTGCTWCACGRRGARSRRATCRGPRRPQGKRRAWRRATPSGRAPEVRWRSPRGPPGSPSCSPSGAATRPSAEPGPRPPKGAPRPSTTWATCC